MEHEHTASATDVARVNMALLPAALDALRGLLAYARSCAEGNSIQTMACFVWECAVNDACAACDALAAAEQRAARAEEACALAAADLAHGVTFETTRKGLTGMVDTALSRLLAICPHPNPAVNARAASILAADGAQPEVGDG